jgi:predicted amidohydrolase
MPRRAAESASSSVVAPLSIVVAQTAPRRLEVEHNRAHALELLAVEPARSADLVVLPELALTGYDLGPWAHEYAVATGQSPMEAPDPGPAVVLGFPRAAPDGRVYNAVGLLRAGRLVHVHHKRYLPTYGMFDEGRIFAPGRRAPDVTDVSPGWPTAMLVCEELWHPVLSYVAALRGASLLVVVAAGPGRGIGGADAPNRFTSIEAWTLLARTTALTHGLYVVLCNRAGIERGVTFAGGSLVVGPDGEILARGRDDGPDLLSVTLRPEAVLEARRPYSHLRDEDPSLVVSALQEMHAGREQDGPHQP